MEVVENLRCIAAVTNLGHVVGIDDIVAIDVLILDVTGTDCCEGLLGAVVNVFLVLEETDSYETVG